MDTASVLRNQLVDSLVERGLLKSPPFEAAFRQVARHMFLPGVPLAVAYSDEAVPTKADRRRLLSSSSQPAMMAIMLEQLQLASGMNVLEIGAGTGYNAAIIAHIVGESGHVTTLDIDADTSAAAAAHLDCAGFERVDVICADGRRAWPARAPYDRIIATAAVASPPTAWMAQLHERGIIVAPVGGLDGQRSVALERAGSPLVERSSVCCSFMLLRDAAS